VSVDDGNNGNATILEFPARFTSGGTVSIFAMDLTSGNTRGLAFDASGNLFAAEPFWPGTTPGDILEFTPTKTIFASGLGLPRGGGAEFLAITTGPVAPPSSAVTLTYPDGATGGTTTVMPIIPAPTPPAQFDVTCSPPPCNNLPPLAYEITTTVTTPTPPPPPSTPAPIIIAFQVPTDYAPQFQDLRVLHNGVDVTCPIPNPGPTPDPTTLTIYASVTSLSPFEIAKLKFRGHVQQPVNVDGSSVFSVRRGVVPVKFTLTQDGTSTCGLPAATIAVTRTAGGTVGSIDVYSGSADNGSNFRIDGCQYVYNLSASALGVGTYRVDILIGGVVVGSGTFELH